jgi:hypothetical protein
LWNSDLVGRASLSDKTSRNAYSTILNSGKNYRVNKSEPGSIDLAESIHHARSVISVLQEAVSKGEMKDIQVQLPEEFKPLFEAGSEGSMSQSA